jgi:internalin A
MAQLAVTNRAIFHRRLLTDDPKVAELLGDPFRPLEPECKVVQFERPLTDDQLRRAAELVADRPDVQIYVYLDASRDLHFLRHFPTLRRLQVALFKLDDISGFAHVAGSLEQLNFGNTKRPFSLRFLETLPRLTDLFLDHHKKDLAVISRFTGLTKLGLSGITMPDLSLLMPLQGIRELCIFLGGTANLGLLPRLPALELLRLMRINKLSDLGMLGDLVGLTKLELIWMRTVTSLPNFARLSRLEDVKLETMKGLTDLSPVAAAPALRRLAVWDVPLLTPESFRCLVGHPRLEELHVGIGSRRKNEAVKVMFPGIAR